MPRQERLFFRRTRYILSNITVEPLLFLALLPSVMNHLTTQNLYLEKSCRVNLKYNNSICDAMMKRDPSGYEQFQEAEAQKLVSRMIAIKMIVTGTVPALLMLFLGSWSDRHGRRKPLILIPIIGDLIGTLCLFVCAYFFLELSVEYVMLAETIPFALGGTWACYFLGIYTYVSGLCSDEERTIRIGTVTMCQNISFTLGIFLSGIMINLLGFRGVYTLSAVLLSISIVYGSVIIKENSAGLVKKKGKSRYGLGNIFSMEHVRNTFRICFKEGPNNRRTKMFVIMFLSAMVMGPLHGEFSVVYLYTRIKYGWNEIDFSFFNSVQSLIQVLGSIFALTFLSKYLQLDDALLGVIAMASKIVACIFFAFATSGLIFYMGAFIEVFHGTCHIALRSIMSKIVPPHELGQSNSVFGIFEAVTPMIFGPLYTQLYNATITTFPGAFYLFSTMLYLITFGLFFWIYSTCQTHLNDQLMEEKCIDAKEEPIRRNSALGVLIGI